ncbi:MAG TPA: phytanoyl-CoA dioxygenase family protein, partial [Polyangiaceae bacterium]|nr:phytanoyl-CoA dioxygenase family protein [Polyangiaceae bacterium]
MQKLSAQEIERFKQTFADDGYVVIPNVVSKEKLAALRIKLLDALELSQRTGDLFNGGGGISGHLNCFPGEESRFAYDTLVERGIIDLVRELAPHAFGPLRAGCNMNLPRSVAQHYHMDGIFLEDFMIANVAVVDTDIVNGAIDVVPGT